MKIAPVWRQSVNAMIPDPGETARVWWVHTGALEAQHEAARVGGYGPIDVATYFLYDVDPEVAASGEPYQRPEADIAFRSACDFTAWPAIGIRLLAGHDDRFFPVGVQRRVARDRLGVEVDVLAGGHLLPIAQPRLVGRLPAAVISTVTPQNDVGYCSVPAVPPLLAIALSCTPAPSRANLPCDHRHDSKMAEMETVTLSRRTGPNKLSLVEASGWKAWPARLPDRTIFDPVLNQNYAMRIARDWNVKASGAGFATGCAHPYPNLSGVRDLHAVQVHRSDQVLAVAVLAAGPPRVGSSLDLCAFTGRQHITSTHPLAVQTPADHPVWRDPDDLLAAVGGLGLGLRHRHCGATDFKPTHRPWVARDEIVDHQCDLTVVGHVGELAGSAERTSGDVEGAVRLVEPESDRVVLQGSVGTSSR